MPESTLNSYQFKTPNASVGSNAANQQRAAALDPTGGRSGAFGVRSPQTPNQGRGPVRSPQAPRAPQTPTPGPQPGAENPILASYQRALAANQAARTPAAPQNPALPDFSGMTPQQLQQMQALMGGGQAALPPVQPPGTAPSQRRPTTLGGLIVQRRQGAQPTVAPAPMQNLQDRFFDYSARDLFR